MAHTHTRTEVGVSDSFGGNCFEHGAYYRVASRIPSGRDDRYSSVFFGASTQFTTQVNDACMNIKAVYCVDAHCENLFCVFLNAAGRSTKNSHVYSLKFLYIFNYCVIIQFSRFVLGTCTTNHTCYLKIGSRLEGFQHITTNIAITYDGCSYFFHLFIGFV